MRSAWLYMSSIWNSLLLWTGIRKLSFRDKLPPEARVHFDEIIKLFKGGDKGRSTVVSERERVVADALNPTRANLWTATLGNIEPFLVSEVSPPSIVRVLDEELGKTITTFTAVHLSFHDTMGTSMVARLASLMNGEIIDLTVRLLDHLGNIVEVWKMRVRPVAIHPLVVLEYSQAEPIRWQLECECSKWEIQVVDGDQNSGTVN